MFSNIIAGAAGFPVADLGDTVSQSLRFRGGQELNRPQPATASNRQTFTLSTWIKKAENGPSQQIFNAESSAGGSTIFDFYYVGSDETIQIYEWTGSAYALNCITNAAFRDPSAWYHIVLRVDTTQSTANDRVRLYVNGEQQTFATNTQPSQNYETNVNSVASTRFMRLGQANSSVGGGQPLNGYMAAVNFIDGQSLEPTNFGRYQEDGVWVPKNYTGTYGTNGFHLDFADGSNPGNDVSGNNNDFTASGFDTAPAWLPSNDLFTVQSQTAVPTTSTRKNFNSVGPASEAFDGSTASGSEAIADENAGSWLLWLPSVTTTASTSVRVWTAGCETIGVNGSDTGIGRSSLTRAWVDISSALTFPITITSLAVRGTAGSYNAFFGAIEIDGTIIVDNTDNDVDFLDTPTSNYATWNPVNTTGGDSGIQSANLEVTDVGATTAALATASIAMTSGKYYFEFVRKDVDNGTEYGIKPADTHISGNLSGYSTGVHIENAGDLYVNGSRTQQDYLTDLADDDVLNVAFDADTRKVWFGRNGTFVGDPVAGTSEAATHDESDVGYIPWIRVVGSGGNETGAVNFGQMPFIYTAPSGFSALQTNNLPEPTIKNGKEHFDVVTYSGSGTETQTLTGLEFAPDLVWIKHRNGASTHSLGDSVRGAGANSLRPDTNNAEGTGASTNGYISAFTSDGFTVHRGGSSGVRVNGGTGEDYVAWCWKAGTSYTPTLSGFSAATASINTEAGFGIYALTGANTASSFTHGLDSTPEVIICKNRDDAEDWVVFYPKPDGPPTAIDTYLRLNEQTDENKNGTQILTGNTSTTVSVASFNETASDDDYIYYLWHSVEGFSKMGRYQGNGSSDGVFVYCGFRPAFVMVKGTGTTNGWGLYDNARFENNPVNGLLYANSSNKESAFVNRPMDFLSNGFKCRDGNTNINASASYMFMAFAEHPFGGENAPPVTAR